MQFQAIRGGQESPNPPPKATETPSDLESKRLIAEIAGFRHSLGLDETPPELVELIQENNRWTEDTPKFQNDLPEKDQSYGLYIEEVIPKVFGPNCTRLVKGCKNDPNAPGGIAFNPTTRFCNMPIDVHNTPIDGEFINPIMHEAVGHGSDPFLKTAKYPNDVLLRVEHGKWRALTQMFSIPEQFLNNPGDQMYPYLKKEMGKTIGKVFVASGDLGSILDDNGKQMVWQQILQIAKEHNVEPGDLKFNKNVCRRLGTTVVSAVLSGQITLKGELRSSFTKAVDYDVAVEIYAEMMRYAILYPEKVNETIREGVKEVLEAINGKPVNLAEIREGIIHPSEDILKRNLAEAEALKQIQRPQEITPENNTSVPALTTEEVGAIKQQQNESNAQKSIVDGFLQDGVVPGSLKIPSEYLADVMEFSELCREMNRRYPDLFGRNMFGDDGYDPDLNIWDIEDLGYAYDAPFVRGTLYLDVVSAQVDGEIKKKNEILKKFLPMNLDLNPVN